MCGIAGLWRTGHGHALEPALRKMLHQLQHRGPDDEGVWMDHEAGVALGQRRLAIVDLSPGGHQPMLSSSGRFCITFNGEIYNFLELRAQLEEEGVRFRSTSDTEVLLEAVERWGIDRAIARAAGMFALALWDRERRILTLARDRFGKKPLYYAILADGIAFASELRSLETVGVTRDIDRGALTLLMRNGYIAQPHSIWREVRKLPQASVLELTADSTAKAAPRAYWSARSLVEQGHGAPWEGGDDAMLAALETKLALAVRERMITDVPLGAFLSGGVDSSLVVSMMQEQSERPVRTFTIGFHEADYDEAAHAKRVAEHLGTEHTELYVTAEEAMKVVPRLARIYDEPFADSSQIPTYLVSRLARRHVTVALSGDGGDEVFAGYNRYLLAEDVWRRLSAAPRWTRSAAARAISSLPPSGWDACYRAISLLLPRRRRLRLPGQKAHKLARMMAARTPDELYEEMVTIWRDPARVVQGGFEPDTLLSTEARAPPGVPFVERMMYLDTMSYLPDDILTKVDRASMAVSLETRAPLLDHRVFEFACRLPARAKIRDGVTKWPLRQLLYRRVPRDLLERPKMGFGVPVGAWLRGPMRSWAEDLLDADRLRREGYLDPERVQKAWREHLSGRRNWDGQLWAALMFQLWLEAHEVAA